MDVLNELAHASSASPSLSVRCVPPMSLEQLADADQISPYTLLIKVSTWSMEFFYDLFCEYQALCKRLSNSSSDNNSAAQEEKQLAISYAVRSSAVSHVDRSIVQTNRQEEWVMPSQSDPQYLVLPSPLLSIDNLLLDIARFRPWGPRNPQFKTPITVKSFPRNVLRFKPFRFTNRAMVLVYLAARNLGHDVCLVDLDRYDFCEDDPDLFLKGRWKFEPLLLDSHGSTSSTINSDEKSDKSGG